LRQQHRWDALRERIFNEVLLNLVRKKRFVVAWPILVKVYVVL